MDGPINNAPKVPARGRPFSRGNSGRNLALRTAPPSSPRRWSRVTRKNCWAKQSNWPRPGMW